jgi:uncharacterized membrane protein YphA (DoxX/SURF4 family)
MKPLLGVIRWLIGILFIFSGLIKANDPLGLSYKMQEFFDVWGWHFMSDYSLALSIAMNIFEVTAGVAIIVGWRVSLVSWLLLLLIIFFTFLTAFALFSGKIKTCGCFGDCIPLSAQTSFIKDVVLFALILVVWWYRKNFQKNGSRLSFIILFSSLLGTAVLQAQVLMNLPIIDCLPYAKGKNIKEQMLPPDNAIPDSTVMVFIYQKEGKTFEFINDVPESVLNDSTYLFIDRKDKIVRKGNATPAITDLLFFDAEGNDMTGTVLSDNRLAVWMLVKSTEKFNQPTQEILNVNEICRKNNLPFYVIGAETSVAELSSQLPGSEPLVCDGVVVKTAARAIPVFFLVQDGDILEKEPLPNLSRIKNRLLNTN